MIDFWPVLSGDGSLTSLHSNGGCFIIDLQKRGRASLLVLYGIHFLKKNFKEIASLCYRCIICDTIGHFF